MVECFVKIANICCKYQIQISKYTSDQYHSHKDSQKQTSKMFFKKGVLKNFVKLTGKHLCCSLFFNKAAGLRTTTLLRKRLWHRCFPVNFAKFLRTPFLQNTSGHLLLKNGVNIRHYTRAISFRLLLKIIRY